jgi:hypothetical protein
MPITLISAAEARRREGDRHRATQWRDRRRDPRYPKPVYRNGGPYFVESEHEAYLRALIDERTDTDERDPRQLELIEESAG